MSELHFLRPWILLLLLALPLAWRLRGGFGMAASAWEKVVDRHLIEFMLAKKTGSSHLKILIFSGFFFGIVSAAGPSWEKRPAPAFAPEAAAMILLDLSSEMTAEDLARAKYAIADFLDGAGGGTAAGLVVYSGEPFLVSPITSDLNIIKNLLPAIDFSIMPTGGNDRGRAAAYAGERLKAAGYPDGKAVFFSKDIPSLPDFSGNGAKLSENAADTWADGGYWLCFIPLLCCLALFRRGVLACAFLIFASPASAGFWLNADQEGLRDFEAGAFGAAAAEFKAPAWRGASEYRRGAWEKAYEAFALRGDAEGLYNQGNALAKGGKIDEAIAKYEEILKISSEHEDAQFNLEYLKKQQSQNNNQDNSQERQDKQEPKENPEPENPSGGQDEENEPPAAEEESQAPAAREKEEEDSGGQEAEAAAQSEQAQAREMQYREIPEDPGGLMRAFIAREYARRKYKGGV